MLEDLYTSQAPSAQDTLDLFRGEWSSQVPVPGTCTGHAALFRDDRIAWLIEQDQSYRDKAALELGPLEAGHTYMLERSGYDVTAVEGNSRAFLKCLVVKELLGLKSHFLFGDINEHLKTSYPVGLCVASGVLYQAVPVAFFLWIGVAALIGLLGLWLVTLVRTAQGAWRGTIFLPHNAAGK